MKYYPLFFNLRQKKAAVFGGGRVAQRKVRTLLQSGARVEIKSRDYAPGLMRLARRDSRLRLRPKASVASLLKGASLAFIASSDRDWNRKVAAQCRRRKVWVNIADQPEPSDFFVPSVLEKGKLQVAVSTGGASPLFARKFREEIQRKIRPEAIRLLAKMDRWRGEAKRRFQARKDRQRFFARKIGRRFHFLRTAPGRIGPGVESRIMRREAWAKGRGGDNSGLSAVRREPSRFSRQYSRTGASAARREPSRFSRQYSRTGASAVRREPSRFSRQYSRTGASAVRREPSRFSRQYSRTGASAVRREPSRFPRQYSRTGASSASNGQRSPRGRQGVRES